jgi:hypothetical protein
MGRGTIEKLPLGIALHDKEKCTKLLCTYGPVTKIMELTLSHFTRLTMHCGASKRKNKYFFIKQSALTVCPEILYMYFK